MGRMADKLNFDASDPCPGHGEAFDRPSDALYGPLRGIAGEEKGRRPVTPDLELTA